MHNVACKLILSASVAALAVSSSAACAQEAEGASATATVSGSDIIVTARKRQESILKVPVVVTAVSNETLDIVQATDLTDLPKLVPGLSIGGGILSVGSQVTIRGVGTSSNDPGIDQSVSLNIDGLSLGQGLAFTSGMFDLQQIEVMKGPQALFYGKSSPGGVISMRTADPSDRVEVMARAGYEFEGREGRGELIVSGPLNDTLKARLAGMYAAGGGYFHNRAVPVAGTGAAAPYSRETRPRNFQLRGTVLWNPTDTFSARLKMNLVRDRATNASAFQMRNCPEGTGSFPGLPLPFLQGDDCRLNRTFHVAYMDPAAFPGISNNGVPFLENRQKYGTLELNYDVTGDLSLTSTSAYYSLRSKSLANTAHSTGVGTTLAIWNRYKRDEFTQELRLNSDFEGPFNFTLGAFYQNGDVYIRTTTGGNRAIGLGTLSNDGSNALDIETFSLFGQGRYRLTPELEFSAGARWTDEKRAQDPLNLVTGVAPPIRTDRIQARNVSPEFTLNYTPTDDLTLFASFKQAYKSGSFSIATLPRAGIPNDFGDEKVQGGELGIKSRLFDRSLVLNVALYDYRYKGLQVGASQPSVSGMPIITTINAGRVRTYGVDIDAAYRPSNVDGLSLNASVNWNHGRYTELDNATCWTGQTVALGCDRNQNPATGLYTAQDLSGMPLIRAAKWQANLGFDYEFSIGSGMTAVVANNNQYSSRYLAILGKNRPNNDNFMPGFIKTDLTFALRGPENRWEIAAIGKNITDKITAANCSASNFQGGLVYGQVTGGTEPGSAGFAEAGCYTERGRSVWLRLTFRPFQ